MSLFQKSVINKYLKNLDDEKVSKAYENFQKFYGDKLRLYNIMQLKEENYQEGFLREIFVETLGYTINPDKDYNLTTEFKNLNDARKADGAILDTRGHVPLAIGVIELKSTKTKHLESIKEQAFSYKNNQPGCRYVITSNFQSLRFYIDDATEYEEFNLFNLKEKDFKLLYLLLSKESIFSDLPERLKQETKFHENDISAQLYTDYKRFKDKIFENLVKNNPQYDKLLLFRKSQKLLDRFLFVFFAEDRGLIPPNAVSKIIEQWKMFKENDEYFPLYSRFQKLFSHLDKGYTYKTWGEIPAYNGGLFRNDELLDSNNLKIDDNVLEKDSLILSAYDFNTDVDVNILGHIFEHSLNEIENITAQLQGEEIDKKKTKRKKDGIFYTPKYITKYIVENTVGTLCKEKKEELQINNILIDDSFRRTAKTRRQVSFSLSEKGKKLYKTLNSYKDWLLNLKILDPACGSGAFLNAALDYLIAEHKQIDNLIADLTGDALGLFDTDKAILENNIYGVDINEESVEIAKLSLWLRTAQKGRPLSDLSGNIKCGNSLIDDPAVAGDKAFDWGKEFPQIFKKKEKEAWHITLATHDSRTSQRMIDYKVRLKRDGGMRPKAEPIWLDTEDELIVTKHIAQVIKEDNLNVTAYNICGDHVHLLLICEKEELSKIVGKIKAVSARKYNIEKGITIPKTANENNTATGIVLSEEENNNESDTTRGQVPLSRKKKYNSLWVQKFGKNKIKSKEQYNNTLNYIVNNRKKHKLPENKELKKIIADFVCSTKHAFRPEYKGGFDVVIGNPPYGASIGNKDKAFINDNYTTVEYQIDTYTIFIEKGNNLLKINGRLGYIIPSTWLTMYYFKELRNYLVANVNLEIIFLFRYQVFNDVTAETSILIYSRKQPNRKNLIITDFFDNINEIETKSHSIIEQKIWSENTENGFNVFFDNQKSKIINKIKTQSTTLANIANSTVGIKPYQTNKGKPKQTKDDVKNRIYDATYKISNEYKQYIVGRNFNKYLLMPDNTKWLKYGLFLAEPRQSLNFFQQKILVRQTSDKIIATIDDIGYLTLNNVHNVVILNKHIYYKYVLSLLNSKLSDFYYLFLVPEKGRTFAEVKAINLLKLPIKEISKEAQQPFIKKADLMLSLNKELQNKSDKFIKRIKSNLEVEKITGKLQHFYDYDFKTFLSELKKQKIKLSLKQQDEWEEYFEEYKKEINQLQTQISQTDKEIDKMVYELYELTEEEIGIVENSVK